MMFKNDEKNKSIRLVLITAIFVCILTIVCYKAYDLVFANYSVNSGELASYQTYYDDIVNTYDGEVDPLYMQESILSGITAGLGDPHSTYLNKEDEDIFFTSLSGDFEGIGITYLTNEDGSLYVTDISEGGGAKIAGVYPGDQVIEINDYVLDEDNSSIATAEIPNNPETYLKVYRESTDETLEFDITNQTIAKPSVESQIISHDGSDYGYISLSSFAEDSATEFESALDELESEGIDGLIIDVRNNGGGYLNVVEDILNSIVSDERPFLYTKTDGEVVDTYTASSDNSKDYPIVGLQNENTASASEVLNGALKELNMSDIVGTTSYGKGTVQTTYDLDDLGSVKITIEHWYTPDDNTIDGVGIEPTIEIEEDLTNYVQPILLTDELEVGTYDQNNIALNYQLNTLGYDVNVGSNGYDEKTENAVSDFQSNNDLEVTGIVDVKTAYSIYELSSKAVHSYSNDNYIKAAIDSME